MGLMLLGANAALSLIVGLFFLRSWRDTRDRFFLFFALAFAVEGLNRMALGLTDPAQEDEPYFYLVRLFSFLLILAAIVDKNRKKNSGRHGM
ncbi:MAG TPA: DUF5985 family protein [Blastocatellia bacterium]